MKNATFVLSLMTALASGQSLAHESDVPKGIRHLDHVFLIMMENHGADEILNSANAPFINSYAKSANLATNYWAVGHPSLTNYLEVVGGSNFGVTDDFWPNWKNGGCVDNAPGSTGCVGAIAPISGNGMDVANPLTVDPTTDPQIGPQPGPAVPNNWSIIAYPSAPYTAKTIADQLAATGRTWKTYQESLPGRVDGVNYSDGLYSNISPASTWTVATPTVQKLYAVKHNPFVYFRDVQENRDPKMDLSHVVGFDGLDGLWADLASGNSPNFAFIAPNQCNDMHGAGGGSAFCGQDNNLLHMGDATVEKIVTAIKGSRSWREGNNAIVLVWDENDYANAQNRVVLTVETNYAPNGRPSNLQYNHFSLTKTLEAGFGLPCLNHACDASTKVMFDLFGGH
jgi:hypothetical protein